MPRMAALRAGRTADCADLIWLEVDTVLLQGIAPDCWVATLGRSRNFAYLIMPPLGFASAGTKKRGKVERVGLRY